MFRKKEVNLRIHGAIKMDEKENEFRKTISRMRKWNYYMALAD